MSSSAEELLFAAAASFDDLAARKKFLDWACRDDDALRRRIDGIFAVQKEADVFFEFNPRGSGRGTKAAAASVTEGVGTHIGRYRLLERIGKGGCGVVYLAEQETPVRRRVALKIIKLGIDTEAVIARFELERQALAQTDHVNIARVLDAGATTAGRPYFVMELVEGRQILDFCDCNLLGIRQRLELFVQVCQAIQHAHQKGIIHRDIKPSNVLIDERNELPTPKVIDFGIAKATEDLTATATVTRCDQFLGTPIYMSPEQARGSRDVDTRTDIYSLGALLYELVAGMPPFEPAQFGGRAVEEVRRVVQEEEPPLPSVAFKGLDGAKAAALADLRRTSVRELTSQLAGDLDSIIAKAMDKERSRRYESANGLAMDVQRHLHDEPVLARPPSRLYRLRKLVRRNRLVFVAAAISLLGLLAGLGFSSWMYFRERAARQEQVRLREQAEYRELITSAAVRLKYGDLDGANLLLAKIPVPQTPCSTEAVRVFGIVAQWHLRAGRLREAAARYASHARAVSCVDLSDRAEVSIEVLPAAAVMAYAGEAKAYDDFRRFVLARFGGTSNPQVAEQTLKACLLLPADGRNLEPLERLARLVEHAVESREGLFGRRPENAAWGCFALALWKYRTGETSEAGKWIQRCLTSPGRHAPRVASCFAVQAILEQRSGNAGRAASSLARARSDIEETLSEQKAGDGSLEARFEWIAAAVLLTEAERVVERR